MVGQVRGRSGPGVQDGPVHGSVRSTVRSTGRHGPFSGEGRTDPPLDRTVVGHETVHGPVHDHSLVRYGLDRLVHFKPDKFNTVWLPCSAGHTSTRGPKDLDTRLLTRNYDHMKTVCSQNYYILFSGII
jgi:hypothetical protein